MNQTTKKTQIHNTQQYTTTAKMIVSIIFGTIGVILAMRFIFKLLGANSSNIFIRIIYGGTQFFVGIFEGIFPERVINDASGAVFEPATMIGMILMTLLAWLVLTLMTPRKSNQMETTEDTTHTIYGDHLEPDDKKDDQ